MSAASVLLVADDYGLSPGVSAGIRALIGAGRLSGTGCMTLFPEWQEAATALVATPGIEATMIGLHLTLTDAPPLTGTSALAPAGRLPALKALIRQSLRATPALNAAIARELDAQLKCFTDMFGRAPDYIDGHQHVHFLPPVRRWLKARRRLLHSSMPDLWLRGAPSLRLAPGLALKAKVAVVALIARGFDAEMRGEGFRVAGPLAGFYDWSRPQGFGRMLARLARRLPEGAVVMVHPGETDALLEARDGLIDARPVEAAVLAGPLPFSIRRRLP